MSKITNSIEIFNGIVDTFCICRLYCPHREICPLHLTHPSTSASGKPVRSSRRPDFETRFWLGAHTVAYFGLMGEPEVNPHEQGKNMQTP